MSELIPLQKEGLTEQTANETRLALRNDPEVASIIKAVDWRDANDILTLGKEPSQELSRFTDKILHSMTLSKLDDSSDLLKQLEKVMNKFDKDEILKEPSFFGKLFNRAKKSIDSLFAKYTSLGGEIDKIHQQFMIIEDELKKNNVDLEGLYQEDIQYYLNLEKYAVAAEMKLEELRQQDIPQLETQVASGNQMARIQLENLRTAEEILDRKVDDLEKARMVAVIAAPQIKTIQRGNNDLIAKINSAFVTTIPIFKMGIINAVNAKRQKLHADSINAFEDRANEMLRETTKDIMNQSVDIARKTGTSSIKMDTIEDMWDTITKGIDEYKQVKDEQVIQRKQDRKRLEEIRNEAKDVFSGQ